MNSQSSTQVAVTTRLARMRDVMSREGVDALLVPSADPHLSEYLPGYWQGRQWLSGFHGSVGTLIITADFAGLWVDSRYWEQAEKALSGSGIVLMKLLPGQPGPLDWLAEQAPEGGAVAVDGTVMALASARQLEARLKLRNVRLLADKDLLLDVWDERPPLPANPVYPHLPPYATVSRVQSWKTCVRRFRRVAPTGISSPRWMTLPGCSTCAAVMSLTTRCLCRLPWSARRKQSCSWP